ncbi:hypothetical protein ACFL6I_06425 [candidate division KSB1 bacterium]
MITSASFGKACTETAGSAAGTGQAGNNVIVIENWYTSKRFSQEYTYLFIEKP